MTSLREALAALADANDARLSKASAAAYTGIGSAAIRALLAAHPAPADQPETRLTDAERSEIGWAIERDWQQRTDGRDWDDTFAAVERIIAARLREEGGRHE